MMTGLSDRLPGGINDKTQVVMNFISGGVHTIVNSQATSPQSRKTKLVDSIINTSSHINPG
jgi:hypothetical protein